MDPQSAVNALNQPWWAKIPPLELAGQGIQQIVQALGGNQDTLHNPAVELVRTGILIDLWVKLH